MPRIYKGTAATLKLLIPTCNLDSELTDVSVTIYTDPKDGATVFTKNIEIDGNILTLEIPSYTFSKESDGVINYKVEGKLEGEKFIVQRQSNYYLKTPDGFDPGKYPIPGDVKVTSLEKTITENGTFNFKPEEDNHSNPIELWEGATITVDVPTKEGISCNLGTGIKEITQNGTHTFTASDDGYDGYNVVEVKVDVPTEGGSCNLEDKLVTPSMNDRDSNGAIVVEESEGYNGLSRVVIVPDTIYNEGVEAGRAEGGDCPELTEISITENGRYEGAYNVVNVDVPTEGGCNLEDKIIEPTVEDVDESGWLYVHPSEGYNGMSRTALGTTSLRNSWYNEGLEAGRAEGGEGGGESGSCNLGVLDWTLDSPYGSQKNASDDGYDGYSAVVVRPENVIAQEKENAINDFKNKMKEITITENVTYSIDDQILVESLRYNGGYHTDTISTYDINRIEVTFKADTSESINGQGHPFIFGGSLLGVSENSDNNACARAIQYAYGRVVGFWEGKNTNAAGTLEGEWITIVLDENGMTVKYPTYEEHCDYTYDNGKVNSGADIFPFIIGGQGRRGETEDGNYSSSLLEDTQFRGLIKEIKINTNSMGEITYIPKDGEYGNWDRKVENTGEYLSALNPTEGEVTMNGEWEHIYPNGFKRVEVNVPTIQDSAKDYYYCPLILGDTGFGEAAKSWTADMITFNGYDGNIIEDKLYMPTFGNRNEFRTKTKARFVQTIKNASDIGTMEFGDGVEYIVLLNNGLNFTNLAKLVIGKDMNTINFGSSTFPVIKEIWSYSTTSEIDVYFSLTPTFNGGGTLYLKNKDHEAEWRNSLPSDWTIVYI